MDLNPTSKQANALKNLDQSQGRIFYCSSSFQKKRGAMSKMGSFLLEGQLEGVSPLCFDLDLCFFVLLQFS